MPLINSDSLFLSIIIPVYNTEQYLGRCLDSIVMQHGIEWCEIVLVDDGSADASPSICDRYASAYQNIKVIHQSNEGVSSARNHGIKVSGGQYIWLVDSDDFLFPGAIDALRESAEGNPDMICFEAVKVTTGGIFGEVIPTPRKADYVNEGPLRCGDSMYPWERVYRRQLADGLLFDEKLRIQEDLDYVYKLCLRIKGEVVLLAKPLYAYLVDRSTSAIHSVSCDDKLATVEVMEFILKSEADHGRYDPAFEQFVYRCVDAMSAAVLSGSKDSLEMARRLLLLHGEIGGRRIVNRQTKVKYVLALKAPLLFKWAVQLNAVIKHLRVGC